MNKHQTAEIVMFVAKAHRTMDTDKDTMRVWHALLADLDGTATLNATVSLLRKPSPFPPTPGQIRAEVDRMDGSTPPSEAAALGYYMAGQWDAHPAVERAAKRVTWDRHNAATDAQWMFKSMYAAELHREENGHHRAALPSGDGPQRIALDPVIEVIDEAHTMTDEQLNDGLALIRAARQGLKPAPTCETCNSVGMIETSAGAIPCEECSA